MTKPLPLDGNAFLTYCRRLKLGKETQTLLKNVRTSPPSRTPEARRGNMPVWYPSPTMQCVIKAESHKVEFAFLLEAEHDKEVLEFYDQPPRIVLEYRDRRNHLQQPLHTADYFVFRYLSAGWEECKPIEDLMRLAKTHPNRYVIDDQGQWRCPPGEQFAALYGLTYKVRSSDQINWAAQDNWLYIEDYYQDLERLKIPETDLETLLQIVDEHEGISLSDLRATAIGISSDKINIAIARHVLFIDLKVHRLTEPEHAIVFRDSKAADAYHHRGKTVDDMGLDAHPVEIKQGSTIMWDGREWNLHVGTTGITLVGNDVDPFSLSRSALDTLIKQGKIVGLQTETRSSMSVEAAERLEKARAVDMKTATFRNRIINPDQYDDDEQRKILARAATIPARTKRDWKRWYREAERSHGNGYIGLLPGYANCGGQRKADPRAIELIEEVLKTHYDTVTRKPKRGAYGEYKLQSEEKKIPRVTERTFYTLAKRHKRVYEQVLAREGARAAYPFKDYHHPSEKTISRHGSYAWAMGHIDHLEVNLQLCDSKTGLLLGKCWLTMMILTHPRRVASYYLTFDPPSYRSCMMVMRLCVKRYGRLPTALTVDGGSEFRSVYFEQLLALYKVRKHQRPASEPRFGSPLERLFGTMETEFIHHLLGNTQASQSPRLLTKATNPENHAVWTLPALAQSVRQWADEEYDTIPHPALSGMTPREAYNRSLDRDGARDHKIIPYDEVFVRATFPTTARTKSIVQPGKGVRINYLDYWCDEMRDKDIEHTSVPVRYDPFDVTIGYALIGGKWRECTSAVDELAGCSQRELQLIAAEIRKQHHLLYGKEQVELTQWHLADWRRGNSGKEGLLRQQRHDRETKAALAVLEEGGSKRVPGIPSTTTTAPTPVPVGTDQDHPSNSSPFQPSRKTESGSTLRVLRRIR